MMLHIKTEHEGENPYPCPHYSKSFTSSTYLNSHIQYHINSKHIPLDPETEEMYTKYKCDKRDKEFLSTAFLKRHEVVHSDLKEHKCSECGKAFALKIYLNRHFRLVHNTSDPRNVVCKTCGKTLGDYSGLQTHGIHTGETPYHCKLCKAKFRRANALRIHVKTTHETKTSDA